MSSMKRNAKKDKNTDLKIEDLVLLGLGLGLVWFGQGFGIGSFFWYWIADIRDSGSVSFPMKSHEIPTRPKFVPSSSQVRPKFVPSPFPRLSSKFSVIAPRRRAKQEKKGPKRISPIIPLDSPSDLKQSLLKARLRFDFRNLTQDQVS
jgi:hypothetical protein